MENFIQKILNDLSSIKFTVNHEEATSSNAFCSLCRFSKFDGIYYRCNHPENKIRVNTPEYSYWSYKKEPKDLNSDNNCKNFEKNRSFFKKVVDIING